MTGPTDYAVKFLDHTGNYIRTKQASIRRLEGEKRHCRDCVNWRRAEGQVHQGTCWSEPPTGQIVVMPKPSEMPCPSCSGSGKVAPSEGEPPIACPQCGGSGKVQVQIPIAEAQRVLVPTNSEEGCGKFKRTWGWWR
jgi:DnaJ-class molecular chaperone